MVRAETLAAVRTTCEAVLDHRDMELVEFSLHREGRGLVLRVTVDRHQGDDPVSIEEVAEISEEISRALDLEDPIEVRYTLEVSSAGIERPLVKPPDYVRFRGRRIYVKTLEPFDGAKVFRGSIRSSDENEFELVADEGGLVRIPFDMVGKAKLVVDWEEEFRRAK